MTEHLLDAHTFSLDYQGNTYSVTSITQHQTFTTKLIVATLNRKVLCMELSMSHCARPCGCVVVPQSQEIQFTYIPSGAEIISIDAFNRSADSDDFVIGVTIIKSTESGSPGQYLNIYSDLDVHMDQKPFQLENLAQNCVSLLLDFIPYQLTHCQLTTDTVVWCLGGSDRKIHIYSEDKSKHMYMEVDSTSFMPEFSRTFPSVPLWTDMCVTSHGKRVTATGCECGYLVVTTIDVNTLSDLKTFEKEFAGPLTCTKLFPSCPPPLTPPPCLDLKPNQTCDNPSSLSSLHLAVSHSLGETQVFHNIVESNLTEGVFLPESDMSDVVTCLCVADVDMLGENCLILGTYGQMVLCYKCSSDGVEWELSWSRQVSAPVLGVRCEDVTGDGVRELVVVTTRGVQVLQPQLDNVKTVTLQRLRKLVQLKESSSNS